MTDLLGLTAGLLLELTLRWADRKGYNVGRFGFQGCSFS